MLAQLTTSPPDLARLDYWDVPLGLCQIPVFLVAVTKRNLLSQALTAVAKLSNGTWVLSQSAEQEIVLKGKVAGWSLPNTLGDYADWVNLARFPRSNILHTAKVLDELRKLDVNTALGSSLKRDRGTLVGAWTANQAITDRRVVDADEDLFFLLAAFDRLRSLGSLRKVDHRRFAQQVLDRAQLPVIDLFFNVTDDYGGYLLQQGDRDDTAAPFQPRYGGVQRAATGATRHIEHLVTDLRHVGFATAGFDVQGAGANQNLVNDPDRFREPTGWAVREFQIHAGMERIAIIAAEHDASPADDNLDYTLFLQDVNPNPVRYTGPISGMANMETRCLLQYWKRQRYRCPVIVQAFDRNSHRQRTNFWHRRNGIHAFTPAWTFETRDFTGYFSGIATVDGARADIAQAGQVIRTGRIAFRVNPPPPQLLYHGGPFVKPPEDSFFSATMTWQSLTGAPWPAGPFVDAAGLPLVTANATVSTMRVIFATAAVEAGAMFDAVNGYDAGIISVGFYQWTLDSGELLALVALLQNQFPADYKQLFRRFGIVPTPWGAPNMFNATERKYVGDVHLADERDATTKLAWQGNQLTIDYAASWQAVDTPSDLPTWNGNNLEYFRLLPLFYRFVMGVRANQNFRYAMWDMARLRLRALTTIEWPDQAGNPHRLFRTDEDNVAIQHPVRLTEIFSSELTMAIVLRWHVNRPADIANGNQPGQLLRQALWHALNQNPGIFHAQGGIIRDIRLWNWGVNDERVIANGLNNFVQNLVDDEFDSIKDSIPRVLNWPGYTETDPVNPANVFRLGRPSAARGSFRLDANRLPAAP